MDAAVSARRLPPFVAALFFTLRDSYGCLPHLHSMPPLGGFPSEYRHPVWYGKTRMAWLPGREKISKISLFVWYDPQTWQTDRQTDTACRHRPRLCITSRSLNINCAAVMVHMKTCNHIRQTDWEATSITTSTLQQYISVTDKPTIQQPTTNIQCYKYASVHSLSALCTKTLAKKTLNKRAFISAEMKILMIMAAGCLFFNCD